MQAERPITKTDVASIVTSILSGSGMADLDEMKMLILYELFKYKSERTANDTG